MSNMDVYYQVLLKSGQVTLTVSITLDHLNRTNVTIFARRKEAVCVRV